MDHGSAPSVVVEQEDVLAIVAPLRDVTRHTRRHDLGHPSHSVSKEWLLSHSSGAVPDLPLSPDLPDLPPISPPISKDLQGLLISGAESDLWRDAVFPQYSEVLPQRNAGLVRVV